MRARAPSTRTRREVLRVGLGTVLLLPGVGSALALLPGCGGSGERERSETKAGPAPGQSPPRPADRGVVAPPPPVRNDQGLVTEIPSNVDLIAQLQYRNVSEQPDQNCANCLFYTAQGEDRGRCQLFVNGLVDARGWCMTWAPKT